MASLSRSQRQCAYENDEQVKEYEVQKTDYAPSVSNDAAQMLHRISSMLPFQTWLLNLCTIVMICVSIRQQSKCCILPRSAYAFVVLMLTSQHYYFVGWNMGPPDLHLDESPPNHQYGRFNWGLRCSRGR